MKWLQRLLKKTLQKTLQKTLSFWGNTYLQQVNANPDELRFFMRVSRALWLLALILVPMNYLSGFVTSAYIYACYVAVGIMNLAILRWTGQLVLAKKIMLLSILCVASADFDISGGLYGSVGWFTCVMSVASIYLLDHKNRFVYAFSPSIVVLIYTVIYFVYDAKPTDFFPLLPDLLTQTVILLLFNVILVIVVYWLSSQERRVQEKLRVASAVKQNFMLTMSHELRTPMNGILGMVQLLESDLQTAEQEGSVLDPIQMREYLHTLRQSSGEMTRVLRNILDFTQLQRMGVVLERRPFSLSHLWRDLEESTRMAAQAKGLSIRFVAPMHLKSVTGDVLRLRQVLDALISNAIKFTHAGSITVETSYLQEVPPSLLFAITDTGVGIDPEQQTRIFDSFAQADSSLQRQFGGSGLGLSIAQRLVIAMGGQIRVESTPNQGSRFWFVLEM